MKFLTVFLTTLLASLLALGFSGPVSADDHPTYPVTSSTQVCEPVKRTPRYTLDRAVAASKGCTPRGEAKVLTDTYSGAKVTPPATSPYRSETPTATINELPRTGLTGGDLALIGLGLLGVGAVLLLLTSRR